MPFSAPELPPSSQPLMISERARVSARFGRARLKVDVTVSPATFLAIGGMVAMILLGSAAVVRAARSPVR